MNFAIDLISDLNLAQGQLLNWEGKPTSLQCIVNGNISSHIPTVIQTLEHLGTLYDTVLYLDGMLEHCNNYKYPEHNQQVLQTYIDKLDNVIFLNNNIIMIENTVILSTNGWSTFNFEINHSDETRLHLHESGQILLEDSEIIIEQAIIDQQYIMKSVMGLQEVDDVHEIILITNSVPLPALINHDKTLTTNERNILGSLGMTAALDMDINNKISTWIFGRYEGDMDVIHDGVRYVNNTFSTGDLGIYYPKRIVFEL